MFPTVRGLNSLLAAGSIGGSVVVLGGAGPLVDVDVVVVVTVVIFVLSFSMQKGGLESPC
jgi:hypothetical protein